MPALCEQLDPTTFGPMFIHFSQLVSMSQCDQDLELHAPLQHRYAAFVHVLADLATCTADFYAFRVPRPCSAGVRLPKQVLVPKLLAVLSLMLFDDDDDDKPSKKFQQLKIESL